MFAKQALSSYSKLEGCSVQAILQWRVPYKRTILVGFNIGCIQSTRAKPCLQTEIIYAAHFFPLVSKNFVFSLVPRLFEWSGNETTQSSPGTYVLRSSGRQPTASHAAVEPVVDRHIAPYPHTRATVL